MENVWQHGECFDKTFLRLLRRRNVILGPYLTFNDPKINHNRHRILHVLKACAKRLRKVDLNFQRFIDWKQPPEMFYKKAVFKYFAIFRGKHKNWRLKHSCLPVLIAKYLRTPILKTICKRVLLAGLRLLANLWNCKRTV